MKPNLLVIWTDQQRRDTLKCYGNDWIQTPHLNRLAEESFVFDKAYVTQPVCTPSRASVLTGLYPHTTGCTCNNVALRPDTPTIAEMVDPDYCRGYIGKWHLGDEVTAQHGFDHWVSIEDNYREHYSRPEYLEQLSDYHRFLEQQGLTPDIERCGAPVFSRGLAARQPEEMTKAHFCGAEAVRFIHEHQHEPFLLHVNMLEPHSPYASPLHSLYDPATIPVSGAYVQPPPADASAFHRFKAEECARGRINGPGEAEWRRIYSHYLGNVTLIDRSAGMILDALDAAGLADRTLVVFTSDHGDMMGDHDLLAKCVMYEEAVSVPLLMRVPWLGRRQRRVPGIVSQVDLVPTLLELLGQPLPSHLEGCSRASVLTDGGSLADNQVVIEWNGKDSEKFPPTTPAETAARLSGQPWRTIVHDGWKLNVSPVDQCELYDLHAQPSEQVNRINDAACRPRIADLMTRLRRWQTATGDSAPLSAPDRAETANTLI